MADNRLTKRNVELTDPEGHQLWAFISEQPGDAAPPVDSFAARFLAELPAIAWRHRLRIGLGVLAGVALAVAYLALAAPVYVVRGLVQIEQRESVLQRYDALRSGATFIATQAEVIQSPHVIGAAFDSIGLPEKRTPGLIKRAQEWVRSLLPLGERAPLDPRTAALLKAQAALSASPVLGTDLLAVTFRTPKPERGVAFLNALIDNYRDYVRALEADAHREGLELLLREDDSLRHELERLQGRYDEVHAAAPLLGEGEASLSVQKLRLEEHARAHVEAQGRRIELENRLAQYAQNGMAPPAPRDRLVEDLREAEAALAELKASRNRRHPDVRQTEQQIELLREQLARNAATQRAAVEAELRAARRTEQMLSRLYEDEWATTKRFERQRLEEQEILRDIERVSLKREALGALLRDKEIRVISLESGHSGTVVRLLDPPIVPTEKAWPRPSIVFVGFGILGMLSGLGLAVLSEFRERRPLAAAA